MKIIEKLKDNVPVPTFRDIKDIKYLGFFIGSILTIIIIVFIILLSSQPAELTALYLSTYISIIFGFILIIISNIYIYKFTLVNNYRYLLFDLLPLILLIVTTISLIKLKFDYTKKINSNSLTDTFYTFNIVNLGIIFFQFIIYITNIRIDINKSNNTFRIINLLLAIVNIIFTYIIWEQPLYFSTDG